MASSARRIRRILALLLTASVVYLGIAALASAPSSASGLTPGVPTNDRAITHALNRIAFGPRPGDVEHVRRLGLAAYIEQQLHPERISDAAVEARLGGLQTLQLSTREIAEEYFLPALMARRARQRERADTGQDNRQPDRPDTDTMRRDQPDPPTMDAMRKERLVLGELTAQRIVRAAYSERQLQEVLVDFWFNHFNVFAGKGQTRLYLTEYERDTIRPHVFGTFRDLLGATAESPAMLFYLDNWMSVDPNAPDPRRPPDAPPQQARARGLNENYARELLELHTLGVDGGYTQHDVVEVARAFTGWTIDRPRAGGSFRFAPRLHDDGKKVVLGRTIDAGGRRDGEEVLDILARHPSTARLIATKLARRFVADTPPASLVDRAAARFLATDGDLREVVRTIITSPEFFAAEAYRAKVKSPFEFVVSALRATAAEISTAIPLARTLRDLGMPLYFCQPPTGYADRADAWVNTGALLGRMNFALDLVSNRLRGVHVEEEQLAGAGGVEGARRGLVETLLTGDASAETRATLANATEVAQVAALAIGAPEFQRR